MKPPSKWPWLIRFPIFIVTVVIFWVVPIVAGLAAISKFGVFKILHGWWASIPFWAIAIGWSHVVMKYWLHPHVEPFFNIRSNQNPYTHRFTPEPVNSFRDWLRLMFLGR
jgi:hypothetical protein